MTEQTILHAAKTVFLRKGLGATTMQDIAAEAKISRTLLHYYYRNKDTLFRAILDSAVGEFIPKVAMLIELDIPLIEKAGLLVDGYLALLLEDPLLPHFMVMEIQRDPRVLVQLFRDKRGEFGEVSRLKAQIGKELCIEGDTDAALAHIFTSLYGMLIFPFLAKPALDEVFFDNNPDAFRAFMMERKPYIVSMMQTLFASMKRAAATSAVPASSSVKNKTARAKTKVAVSGRKAARAAA
ncbi:TetR/AcrR family transcriptional regulator [Ereboglobus sp. PH5-5]|uniref:TetR/AcrR family transcriptional regulator n=1 Tax=Ereboglobus sp. PH5-5 TaxID=2940529 RepID=UPI00240634C5|nr:TetR/AcrR family transcriptional regulator [Ereboglobus sp. PH5-5]MDF9834111.1 TetR/AcrR family transcriptional regulator [Ereboglobus sp. PH5-5]